MALQRVLTLGASRQTLAVIRSVYQAGHAITVGQHQDCFLARSRYASETWTHVDPHRHEEFADDLVDLLARRPDIRYVFPTGDTTVAAVARHYDRIAMHATPVIPAPEAVMTCMNKVRTYELAEQLGVPVPPTQVAADLPQLYRLADEMGYPCIVKPIDSLGGFLGHKAIICIDGPHMRQRLPAWPADGRPLLVQQYIPGLRINCCLAAWDGEVRGAFQWLILRTEKHDYTGLAVEGVTMPRDRLLWDYCQRLMCRLRYTGLALVQFLPDRRIGTPFLLEINPRMNSTVAFCCRCGFDMPTIAIRCADHMAGRPVAPPAPLVSYPVGRRFHWLHGDLEGWLEARTDPYITGRDLLGWLWKIVRATLRGDWPVTWSARDPRPTLWQYARLLIMPVRRRLDKLSGPRQHVLCHGLCRILRKNRDPKPTATDERPEADQSEKSLAIRGETLQNGCEAATRP